MQDLMIMTNSFSFVLADTDPLDVNSKWLRCDEVNWLRIKSAVTRDSLLVDEC